MTYEHGISVIERESSTTSPTGVESGIQVVVGTAPIHLTANPSAAVNVPIVAYNWNDAKSKLGYSEDFEKYTLCESMYASFELFKIAPVVFINVLDPAIHNIKSSEVVSFKKGLGTLSADDILLSSIKVKSDDDSVEYTQNKDFTLDFNDKRKVVVTIIGGQIPPGTSSLSVEFTALKPEAVTTDDIIGGYAMDTGTYSGMELIRQVHPRLGISPTILLAPGWSHNPEVAAVLDAKSTKISGNFNAENILDVDSSIVTKQEEVAQWKEDHGYTGKRSVVMWPKVKVGNHVMWFSSVQAALMAYTDFQNDNVPYKSPSNKKIPISATVLANGTEIYLDQPQANNLNASGIVTGLNWNGWRSWGNNTGAFPDVKTAPERFISVRRVMDWWGNRFIKAFFNDVDDPTDFRLIESVVDRENINANGFIGKGQIAGASIEFREDMNSVEDILNGKIVFVQKIGAYSPTEQIENILEFDPTFVIDSIFGGE